MKETEILVGETSGQMIECYVYVDHISMFNATFINEGTMYRQINIQRKAGSVWKQAWTTQMCPWLWLMCRLLLTSKEIVTDKIDTIISSEDRPNPQNSVS